MILNSIQRCLVFFGAACVLMFSTPSLADTVAGVKLEETVQVGGQALKLNGAGIRHKLFFEVYVAALYIPELKSTTSDILALPGAKRVSLVLLRELSSEDLSQKFLEGLRKNIDAPERVKFVGSMVTFGKMFSFTPILKKGDVINLDWIPGTGTVCHFNGQKIGETMTDANFYNAILKIWLGEHPADDSLKRKMLNNKSN